MKINAIRKRLPKETREEMIELFDIIADAERSEPKRSKVLHDLHSKVEVTTEGESLWGLYVRIYDELKKVDDYDSPTREAAIKMRNWLKVAEKEAVVIE